MALPLPLPLLPTPTPYPYPHPTPAPAPTPRSAVAWRMEEGNYRDDITALVVYLPCLG